MTADDSFRSSDSTRHARPLRHVRVAHLTEPLALELGGELSELRVAYETYGQLSPERDNAVLICHAISGDSHVAAHDPGDDPGWWDALVGPGKSIDTDRLFVICPNILGGCRGTTGPASPNPATRRPWGASFSAVTVGDMVSAHLRLLDHLGIERLRAAVGGSLGGHQVLELATRAGGRLAGAIALATSPRLTAQALAFDVVGRNAILRDPHYAEENGEEGGPGPVVGLALARMLGHITYLSREAMMERFGARRLAPRELQTAFENKFSVGSYLAYQGEKFVERFDANSYVTLSMAMDLFDLGPTRKELEERLGASRCRWLVVSFSSDWLFPSFQSREIVDALLRARRPVSYCEVTSRCGHDGFLLEDDLDRYGALVRGFLDRLAEEAPHEDAPPTVRPRPTHMLGPERLDVERIVGLIEPGSSVLDVGCGSGDLLARLARHGCTRRVGLEIDEREIVRCVQRGLDVVHADLEHGLACFGDGEFDAVVLSQTLQAARDVEALLAEMLRVGRRCVVSFPNAAFERHRRTLAEEGRAPVDTSLGPFRWYDTPNIRSLSILDFEEFCVEQGIRIERRIALDTGAGRVVEEDPNRHADVAVFVIRRAEAPDGPGAAPLAGRR